MPNSIRLLALAIACLWGSITIQGQAPTISNISSGPSLAGTARITWTTSAAATGQAFYDTVSHPADTDGSQYAFTSGVDSSADLTRQVKFLLYLTPSTTYFYKVRSSNGGGVTFSSEQTFTTAATGVRTSNVLIIRLNFPNDLASLPSDATINGVMTGIDNLLDDYSFGQHNLTWTIVPGTLTAPQNTSFYTALESTSTSRRAEQLALDASALALGAGFNTADYFNYVIWIPQFYDWQNEGFITGVNGQSQMQVNTFSADYLIMANLINPALGGTFRANGWVSNDSTVFGSAGAPAGSGIADPFDLLGGESSGANLNLKHKTGTAWILPANVQTITSDGVYRIFAHDTETALAGGRKYGLRMPGYQGTDYWIEFRQSNPANSVLINWGGLMLLDMVPGGSFNDSALTSGSTFTDPDGRSITFTATGGSTPAFVDLTISGLGAAPPFLTPIPGRIAISSDGNDIDCDDIAASPIALALLYRTGNASKLTYYGYADHIWSSDTLETCGPGTSGQREAAMQDSTEDIATLWGGFNPGIFFNARANTAAAVSALTVQINASTAEDPLWIIAAGPMEVIGQALNTAGANKDHVTVISHSVWNDNHADNPEPGEGAHSGWTWAEMIAAFPTVTFTHIADQNAGLNVDESNYTWLQNSYDPRLVALWNRHIASGETPSFDPSDAGMTYWLISGGGAAGDEGATPRKLRFVIEPNVYPAQGGAWDTATPAEMGFNASAFATALAACPDKTIVIRNGYVVGTKGNVTTTGYSWSASKSLTSMIFGRLFYLRQVTLDATVPGSDFPTAPTATYRQFLTMTSDFGLNQPSHAPGLHFGYNNGGYHHIGTDMKTTRFPGRNHVQTLQDAFVSTLGFEDALVYEDTTFAGPNHMSGWNGGWSMSTRDMARIAYLLLREGNWKGQQVLSAPYLANLYRDQIPASATATTDNDDDFYNQPGTTNLPMDSAWSAGFWLSYGAPTNETISMQGAFGTAVIVSRIHNLVIAHVNTGGTTTNPGPVITTAQLNAIIASIESSPSPKQVKTCKWGVGTRVCR